MRYPWWSLCLCSLAGLRVWLCLYVFMRSGVVSRVCSMFGRLVFLNPIITSFKQMSSWVSSHFRSSLGRYSLFTEAAVCTPPSLTSYHQTPTLFSPGIIHLFPNQSPPKSIRRIGCKLTDFFTKYLHYYMVPNFLRKVGRCVVLAVYQVSPPPIVPCKSQSFWLPEKFACFFALTKLVAANCRSATQIRKASLGPKKIIVQQLISLNVKRKYFEG